MKTVPDAALAAEVSRRGLVKTTAIGGSRFTSSAFTLPFTRIANAAEGTSPGENRRESRPERFRIATVAAVVRHVCMLWMAKSNM